MKANFVILAGAALALGGCNLMGGGFPGNESADAANAIDAAADAAANAIDTAAAGAQPLEDKRAGGDGAAPRTGDAGITNSRSLQAFSGNGGDLGGGAMGGKEPVAAGGSGGPGLVSPEMLVGRWSDNEDCSMEVQFYANRTFRAFNGGRGTWRLTGNSLNLSGGGGSHTMQILSFDGQIMQVRNPDGSIGRSRRC